MPSGHVLHAFDAADRGGVGRGQRRGRAQPGLRVAQPLARRRMVVLFHRVVFGMERGENDIRMSRSTMVGSRLMIDHAAAVVFGLWLVVARGDDDEVHPGGADLLFDGRLGAGAEGDHRQHRRDADGHADRRQRRLQLVARQRAQRDPETRSDRHVATPQEAWPARPSPDADDRWRRRRAPDRL